MAYRTVYLNDWNSLCCLFRHPTFYKLFHAFRILLTPQGNAPINRRLQSADLTECCLLVSWLVCCAPHHLTTSPRSFHRSKVPSEWLEWILKMPRSTRGSLLVFWPTIASYFSRPALPPACLPRYVRIFIFCWLYWIILVLLIDSFVFWRFRILLDF